MQHIGGCLWHPLELYWWPAHGLSASSAQGKEYPELGYMRLVSRSQLHGPIREKLVAALKERLGDSPAVGVALVQASWEAYMHYLFGVSEEGWWGAVDLFSGQAHLFMPRLPEAYAVWMGPLKSCQDYRLKYAVDGVHYLEDMPSTLRQILSSQHGSKAGATAANPEAPGHKPGPIHVLQGVNSDSGRSVGPPTLAGLEDFHVDGSTLWEVLTECRVTRHGLGAHWGLGRVGRAMWPQLKTEQEVAILRYANQVGSAAHVAMMRAAKPGLMEYQLEATYLHHCYYHGGCRLVNYTPISASGPNGAVLHYGHAGAPNDRQLASDDMVLVDMGCEYYRYGSDITCSWPASGRFSQQQQLVYNAVLDAHSAVLAAMRPGVSWPDMHTLANRRILEALLAGGLVRGEVDALLAADIGALFMPHGLGHLLGLDTHDVGGYLPGQPPRIDRPGYRSLRTARKLVAGMVITVEPGCYFGAALLLPALKDPSKSQFLEEAALLPFMSFGGVRIEDNVLVTATGAESLTHVPRTVGEIEAVMAGGPWPA
ncbi:hypothetical protein QJQ45_006957 [Haematococcus lacustris]|nr:hypothetical protein QJQ45_006957 [Haematococcus lacustris]